MFSTNNWQSDFDERYPIYQQIVSRFNRSLVRGELLPGARVPSIRDMALTLKVNTNTVQRAYQEMEREGLIHSRRGTGYFVVEDRQLVQRMRDRMVREATGHFLVEMRELGFSDRQIMAALEQQLALDREEEKNAASEN